MADKKDDAATGAGKKPAAIIDLKATVVDSVTVSRPSVETRAAFANPGAKSSAGAPSSTASVPPSSVPPSKPAEAKPSEASKTPADAKAAAKPARRAALSTPVTKPSARGGFMSHLLSGVAGGALALLGLTQLGPLLNVGDYANAGGVGAANQRITELEQKLAKAAARQMPYRRASANSKKPLRRSPPGK